MSVGGKGKREEVLSSHCSHPTAHAKRAQELFTMSPQEWFPPPTARWQAVKVQVGCVKIMLCKGWPGRWGQQLPGKRPSAHGRQSCGWVAASAQVGDRGPSEGLKTIKLCLYVTKSNWVFYYQTSYHVLATRCHTLVHYLLESTS